MQNKTPQLLGYCISLLDMQRNEKEDTCTPLIGVLVQVDRQDFCKIVQFKVIGIVPYNQTKKENKMSYLEVTIIEEMNCNFTKFHQSFESI